MSATLALLALRWRMVRSPAGRAGLLLVAVLALALLVLGVLAAAAVPLGAQVDSTDPLQGVSPGQPPPDRTGEVAVLLPSALLLLLATAVIGPVAAGGGYELFPSAMLVAYPVRPSTLVRLSLLLTPLNLAWYVQLLLVSVATAYAIRGPLGPGPPLLVLTAYVLAATTVGQALAWLLAGVRRTRSGRVATRALVVAAVTATAWVVWSGRLTDLLDQSPTVRVVAAQLAAADGRPGDWLPVVGTLLVIAAVGYRLAVAAAAWTARRPGDRGADRSATAPLPRRRPRPDAYRALLAVDRASVWRSVPLRRGIWVMGALPAAAGLLAGLSWPSVTLLPPLVASGAVLLFGVNTLALDGPGASWLATLPHDPALVLRAKRRVVLEVTAGVVTVVLLACALRAPSAPTAAEAVAVLASALACTALATTTALHLSVTRPHRADLQGPRDTPAPPGSMALYSLRLAGSTTLLGLLFAAAATTQSVPASLLLAFGVLGGAAWSRRRTAIRWDDPVQRARVVAVVSSG